MSNTIARSRLPLVLLASASVIAFAPAASAFTISGTSITGLNTADINKSFNLKFDGNVDTQNVAGLSSEARFTFKGFTTLSELVTTTTGSGKNKVTTTSTVFKTVANFDILLKNTSGGGITSRVSGLGFNTNQVETAASSTGVFTTGHLNGSFPNQFGNIDVCFNAGSTCQGGGSGGVSNASTIPGTLGSATFSAAVTMNGQINSLDLSNFGVRYQSIGGTTRGTSGTGKVSMVFLDAPPPPPKPRKVAEPGIAMALLLTGATALRLRRRGQVAANAG
jgi:hypothetical protein